jgi:hypothetical protein
MAAREQAVRRAEYARAEERKAFKAKILGKVSIERAGEGAICLNGQERKPAVQISGSGTLVGSVMPNNY